MSENAKLRFLSWLRRGLASSIGSSGTIEVSVDLNGVAVPRVLRVRGPGDVVGLSSRQVLRTDPPDGTTDFEPNYFPAIEFASPDLPWMFTPGAPVDDRLAPWLVLAVVREQEGVSLAAESGAPLTVLTIASPARAADELPSLAEAWAWAHVQCAVAIEGDVAGALAAHPEAFVARLVCPRRLTADTWYRACVVPGFTQGVRAGLGDEVDPSDTSAAWNESIESIRLPVYHSWRFRTGPEGDFEALVRQLTPRELGPEVGMRDLDVGTPGGGLPEAPGTTVSYLGALMSVAAVPREWSDPHKLEFQRTMRTIIDVDTAASTPHPYEPLRDDPIVAPPSYGLVPSGEAEVPAAGANPLWLGDVNLDPAQRATAGVGAEVVRANQEQLVAEAWDQARPLRRINRLLSRSRLAAEVGLRHKVKLEALDDGALLQVAAPALGRLSDARHGTIATRVASSDLPRGTTTAAFRRATRRGGTVAKGLGVLSSSSDASATLTRRLATEPAKMLSFTALVRPAGVVIDQALVPGSSSSRTAVRARTAAPAIVEEPSIVEHPPTATTSLSLPATATSIRAALDPVGTIGSRVRAAITAPDAAWGTRAVPERMTSSPTLDDPTYEMLVRVDSEFMVPGLDGVPMETIGLLVPNPKFVESFLLGVNHELAREFMWREYPADFTDTWMTRFWDAPALGPDIDPVRDWTEAALGAHVTGGAANVGLVLLIKGKLLRRYPDTRIYAVRARWDDQGTSRVEDASQEPREPLFSGKLGRDSWFYAFDLGEEQARAENGGLGWFIVFEECPTGTRFGLDVEKPRHAGDEPTFWTNVSWGHMVEEIGSLVSLSHALAEGRLKGKTHRFDEGEFKETWGEDAAAMARITFQRPVRMLVHMDSMLPEGT